MPGVDFAEGFTIGRCRQPQWQSRAKRENGSDGPSAQDMAQEALLRPEKRRVVQHQQAVGNLHVVRLYTVSTERVEVIRIRHCDGAAGLNDAAGTKRPAKCKVRPGR